MRNRSSFLYFLLVRGWGKGCEGDLICRIKVYKTIFLRNEYLCHSIKFILYRIVSEMLRTAPWNRLSLTVRWLKQEFYREFDPKLTPPLHMALAYGPVKSKKVKNGMYMC